MPSAITSIYSIISYRLIFVDYKTTYKNKLIFRSDNNVAANLSEESKSYRRKRTNTNIQITSMCWLFEFAAGLIAFVTQYLMTSLPNVVIKAIFSLLGMLLDFIIIPSFYLLNTDVCKTAITLNGWFKSIQTLCKIRRSTPVEEIGLERQNIAIDQPRRF